MRLKEKYKGVIVPMVSPFNDDYSIDGEAVTRIIMSFIQNDIIPFILGTTGEAPSLSSNQKADLINSTIKALNGKLPLLAGIGSNSLFTAIEEGKKYADLGVNALVATVSNYYPSDGDQMINWFEKLADNVPVPLFLYNIPATTHHSIPIEVAETLSYHSNIIGIKDSERDPDRLTKSLYLWRDREDFMFLVGWAAMSVFGMRNGANGIVPSLGNLIPELYRQLVFETVNGNISVAEEIEKQTNIISDYCQKGRNISQSIPAMKVMMALNGICGTQVLPPLSRMNPKDEVEFRELMQAELKNMNVIK